MNDEIDIDILCNPLKFPFVGCRQDGEPFEYVLLNLKSNEAKIGLLSWLVNRDNLNVDEEVNLFIPSILCPEYSFRKEVPGRIIAKKWEDDLSGMAYKVSLLNYIEVENKSDYLTFHILSSTSLVELLLFLIKDSALLKSGVNIYINHLIPYFSRIVNYKKNIYSKIEKHFLQDIQQRIAAHEKKLKDLYDFLVHHLNKDEQIPIFVDLEEIRATLESEISFSLFHVIFGSLNDLKVKSHYQGEELFGYSMYIHSIKNLEKRLYSNYNHMVFIYLKSLK